MVVMAVVLTVAAAMICAVKILHPGRLTPLVEHFANKAVNADVSVGRVELAFDPAFPVLSLRVDSLSVISKAFSGEDGSQTDGLPQWRDSLFSLDRFYGTIDLGALLSRGEIALRNVELQRPAVNIVISRSGKGNFDIYESGDSTAAPDDTPVLIPPFSIRRFSIEEPREMRYFNAADSTEATILLMHNARLESVGQPAYSLQVDGNVSSPYAKTLLNLDDFEFGLDGRVRWTPEKPAMLTFEEFRVRGAFVSASLNMEMDYDSTLVVPSASLAVDPVAVTQLLQFVPDSIRRDNRLLAPYFTTDAAVSLDARLLKPFSAATDSIPAFALNVRMEDAPFTYGPAKFSSIGFDISASLETGNPDDLKVDVRRIAVAGPATALNVSGSLSKLLSDPAFDVCMKGKVDFSLFPRIVSRIVGGSLRGRVGLDVDVDGRMSMLSQEGFHLLDVSGTLDGHNLVYISSDTADMVDINRLGIAFNSQVKGRQVDNKPMLGAGVKVDTANILVGGVDIAVGDLGLGVGVENTVATTDTTLVLPVGGGIRIGRLNIESVADSAGVRLRDVAGRVSLHRFKGARRLPEIEADLGIGRFAAGTNTTRFSLRDASLKASMHKKPMSERGRKEIRHLADSIRHANPDLTPDEVIQLAIEKRRENRRKVRRLYTARDENENEMLEWDLATGFRKFLLGWELHGLLTTRSARLYTPLFPLRNRVSRLDISFSNDSVAVNNLRYKAGRSNLVVTGLISNIKRGLTSRRGDNSLKINFAVESDTIDVNQLADAVFAGASYAEKMRRGFAGPAFSDFDDDSRLDDELDAMVSQHPDTTGPLLIPVNIDGRVVMQADNIFYSDLKMKDFKGDILVYDGGLNFHSLTARTDMGNVGLSALYSAPNVRDMSFGFGLDLERMNIERFLGLVPAVDSVLPIMRDFRGIIDAEMAATVDIDSCMNFILPSLDAAVRLSGDSLAFIDQETYATLGKWLRFKDKADNRIKHMNVEMVVRDNILQIFPFSFDIDRYRLGVVGYNDLAMNFDYHISVLKSPLPFKFGITLKGNPDKYKIRLGGAKYKEGRAAEHIGVADTARINLLQQIEGVFRRGVRNSRFRRLDIPGAEAAGKMAGEPDPGLSASDSLMLKQEGLLEESADSIISK